MDCMVENGGGFVIVALLHVCIPMIQIGDWRKIKKIRVTGREQVDFTYSGT